MHRWATAVCACGLTMLVGNHVWGGQRPNIVLLVVDDLGYGELGCYGGTEIATPHIDRLARRGVRFTDAYVTAPFCAASRAGLFTGRYQTRFGFEFNPIGARNDDPRIGLPVEQRTIADALRDAGYITALLGKWHLGGTAQYHPQRRGFDEFYGFLHEGHYYVPPPWPGVTTWLRRTALPDGGRGRWTSPDGRIIWSTHMGHREPDYDANNPIVRGSQPVEEPRHLTDALTAEAEQFIERHAEQPFFLCVAYNAVHSPMQGTDGYMDRYRHIEDVHRRIFAAMLAHVDDSVGRIVAKIESLDLLNRTLIILLSDNGGPTRELTSSNRPLRGEKGQLYEGGIRVPTIIQWVGHFPASRVEQRPVLSLDLGPTMCAAAEVARSQDWDGVDLGSFLQEGNDALPHDVLYWRVGNKRALRQGDWKLVNDSRRGDSRWELYNLRTDLAEAHDLASRQPDRVAALEAKWLEMDQGMAAPLWRP